MLGNEQQLDEDIKPKQGVRPGVLSCSFLIPAKIGLAVTNTRKKRTPPSDPLLVRTLTDMGMQSIQSESDREHLLHLYSTPTIRGWSGKDRLAQNEDQANSGEEQQSTMKIR